MTKPIIDYLCWNCNKHVFIPGSALAKNVTCPNCKGDLTAFKRDEKK